MLIMLCLHIFLCELVRHSLKGCLGMGAEVYGYYIGCCFKVVIDQQKKSHGKRL